MIAALTRTSKLVNRGVETCVAILAIFLTGLLVVSVASRYLVHFSITTSVELTRIAFCWGVFLAAAIGVRRAVHVRILAGIGWLPLSGRLLVQRGTHLITIAFGLAMVWYGLGLSGRMFGTYFPALQISQAWIYAALPVSGALIVLHASSHLFEAPTDPLAGEARP